MRDLRMDSYIKKQDSTFCRPAPVAFISGIGAPAGVPTIGTRMGTVFTWERKHKHSATTATAPAG